MQAYSYHTQLRVVLFIEVALLTIAFLLATLFWTSVCEGSLESCLMSGAVAKPLTFLALSVIRPFVFTPLFFLALLGGKAFGPVGGALLTAIGSVISGVCVYWITKIIGERLAKPWLRANLPATSRFIRSQDYKIVFALRLLPILPFDVASFLFGALDFRLRSVVFATFIGALPEAYLYAKLVDPSESTLGSTVTSLLVFGICVLLPLLIFEFISRKNGTSLWQTAKAMYRELTYEVKVNNDIVRRASFDKDKTPVLLLYGFFSSRRAMTVLEKMLIARGHQVLTFNLGGLFGTFNTRDIIETAQFIDYKIKRQIDRHGFKKVHIVAHSKGGMVALWWTLKQGGYQYCDKIVTMGTPFKGSRFTYLALVTPLGFLWRDVWQMRPRSSFLKSLHGADIPESLHVFCLHSRRDRVARGTQGLFKPKNPKSAARVTSIPMDQISHFEFLYRRDVGDTITALLNDCGGSSVPSAGTGGTVAATSDTSDSPDSPKNNLRANA
jgi:uncharacterized membrane protein YdjX (TVP38/TMEM64 family)/pimeloyl-ACP methyl ester carboxylesterase